MPIASGKARGSSRRTTAKAALKCCSPKTTKKPKGSGGTLVSVLTKTFLLVNTEEPIAGNGSRRFRSSDTQQGWTSERGYYEPRIARSTVDAPTGGTGLSRWRPSAWPCAGHPDAQESSDDENFRH